MGDFNGKWLRNLMCFGVYLLYQDVWKVEWFDVLESKLFLEMISSHFLYNKKKKGIPLNTRWSGKLLVAIKSNN